MSDQPAETPDAEVTFALRDGTYVTLTFYAVDVEEAIDDAMENLTPEMLNADGEWDGDALIIAPVGCVARVTLGAPMPA
jgi:hypothetical protein